ncbi:VOC family protein [Arenimonas sp.]|uniref:VOC family protein n=1 Tax=Arenimonas sp. TaxID=1872635 RepID=UPI0039E45CF2
MAKSRLTPMLNVSDVERSVDFYRRAAGFELVSGEERLKEWRWACMRLGDSELMLSESGGPHSSLRVGDPMAESEPECLGWAAIYCLRTTDVAADHERCVREGFAPTPMRDSFYDMREFQVRDPDGHVLWFGQDLIPDSNESTED